MVVVAVRRRSSVGLEHRSQRVWACGCVQSRLASVKTSQVWDTTCALVLGFVFAAFAGLTVASLVYGATRISFRATGRTATYGQGPFFLIATSISATAIG